MRSTLAVAIIGKAWKNPDAMGIKRLVIVSTIVLLVLGLVVVLLFQTGVDEQIITSLLPKVEKRLNVKISYDTASTSLTTLELNGFAIRSKDTGCTYLQTDRLGVSIRVGPLFFGNVDVTGVRFDGLHVRIGRDAGGCTPEAWGKLLSTLSARNTHQTTGTTAHPRPEIHIASGMIHYNDGRLSAGTESYSGRIGDDGNTVLEIDDFSLSQGGEALVTGRAAELRYDPDQRRVSIATEKPVFNLPIMGNRLLSLLRDMKAAWQVRQQLQTTVSTPQKADISPNAPPPISLGLTIKEASGKLSDSEKPRNYISIQDITVDMSLSSNRSGVLSSSGQLPGTDARFVLQIRKSPQNPPVVTLEIPDMSIAHLGEMIAPTKHLNWSEASLDGKVKAVIREGGERIILTGQSVLSDLSIQHAKIASEPLRGLVLNTDFKIDYNRKDHLLHLERFLVSRNLARATVRGDIHLDRLAFDLYVNLPRTACKHIQGGLPEPFKTRFAKSVFDGQLAFDMHLALDENSPEETLLEANIDNRCRLKEFGEIPEPGYFHGPFAYIAYDAEGEPLRLVTGPGTDRWTNLADISPYLTDAVLTTEDAKFWRHGGITLPEIRRAIELNLKKGALSHGASTITMQLAKNLFLGRERTLSRKLQELVLVWYLESYFSKEQILELYFNIIEYGPSIYGVKDAAMHYFGRVPAELNLLESVFLIKMLPSPVSRYRLYEKDEIPSRQMAIFHRVMNTMHERGRITAAELSEGLSDKIVFHREGMPLPPPREPIRADAADDTPDDPTAPLKEERNPMMLQDL